MLLFRTNSIRVFRKCVGIVWSFLELSALSREAKPSAVGIFVYRAVTSIVTIHAFSGRRPLEFRDCRQRKKCGVSCRYEGKVATIKCIFFEILLWSGDNQ